MKREQQGYKQARPSAPGYVNEQQEQQNGVGGMNQHAGEVMSGWVQMKELVVERMGKPGKGMPVGLLGGSQCPGDGRGAESIADVGIFGDVAVVVVVDEDMPVDRVVQRKCDDDEEKTQDDVAFVGRLEKTRRPLPSGGWFLGSRRHEKILTTEDTEGTEVRQVEPQRARRTGKHTARGKNESTVMHGLRNVTDVTDGTGHTIRSVEEYALQRNQRCGGGCRDEGSQCPGPGLLENLYEKCAWYTNRTSAAFAPRHTCPLP